MPETEYRYQITGFDREGVKYSILTRPTSDDVLKVMLRYKDWINPFVQITIDRLDKDEQDA